MINNGLFSSKCPNWKTPRALYDALHQRFEFDFDPCPTNPTFDGLDVEWGESNFCNPPYGGVLKHWVE